MRGRKILLDVRPEPDRPLTDRQLECLHWVHLGDTDAEIAALLGVSHDSVYSHVETGQRIFDAPKRGRVAFEAWRRGWLD